MAEQSGYGQPAQVLERLDQLEANVNRVLNLQRINDLTGGETTAIRSTQSNGCNFSSLSTGGCTITGGKLATPTS
jgi:hypothetical protein